MNSNLRQNFQLLSVLVSIKFSMVFFYISNKSEMLKKGNDKSPLPILAIISDVEHNSYHLPINEISSSFFPELNFIFLETGSKK